MFLKFTRWLEAWISAVNAKEPKPIQCRRHGGHPPLKALVAADGQVWLRCPDCRVRIEVPPDLLEKARKGLIGR